MSLKGAVLPVTPLQQNCTLLWDEAAKRASVIDPGGDVDRIVATLDELGVVAERILLTHGHIDHAGGAAALAGRLGLPVWGPGVEDRFLLEGLEAQGRAYGIAEARNLVPDRWLAEGDTVPIAGRDFAVLHCPGHTPGHLVYVSTEARVALVGDVLFRGSIGRTDFPYGDSAALIEAIRTKLFPLGDDIAFICGHGPGGSFGEERRSNPFVGERA
ncbi:MBL fold metallo-hydrolase [Elioraea sp.]|uniref:MBL fold metallo-hydrolase n=1 Tax=Elioraea sp. TaxID=2185103 RepID=UPI0021DDB917|nr:MBL fold metallo-hydrolase [Elioraea sp.]GIX10923.1 MAG: hydrolase [Elioraea sp.]